MNGAQLHLALNHFPIILSLVTVVISSWGLFCKNSEIKKVGLSLIIATAVFAGVAFLTGEPAEDVLEKWPSLSKQLVHEHEEAGEAAFIIAVVAGVFALAAVFLNKKRSSLAHYAFLLSLAIVTLSAVAFLRTAHLGGVIKHEEIRTEVRP